MYSIYRALSETKHHVVTGAVKQIIEYLQYQCTRYCTVREEVCRTDHQHTTDALKDQERGISTVEIEIEIYCKSYYF